MRKDLARRKRVMQRSMKLGHCICDPRRGCPCDIYQEEGICPCAGERPDPLGLPALALTSMARNAGCASKIAPADLDAVLERLPPVQDPAVISGLAAADDAAIYQISDSLALVQTVDVFTPCVDDPALFGRICAANCLSDIYAMGGEPRTALSVLAFPSETLDGEIMFQMLSGAMATLAEAGVALVGGHSIKDDEIKLGFAVTGTIDPAVARSLEQARLGDLLVLTKPLGTGVIAFGRQVGRTVAGQAEAERSMATLNRGAAEAMRETGASACTDITGFGLLGHLLRLSRQSGLAAELDAAALPAFPGVLEALRSNVISGAIERNREYVSDSLELEPGLDEAFVHLGCDPQTSGGLLIAIAPEKLPRLMLALADRQQPGWVIGRFGTSSESRIRLRSAETTASPPSHCPQTGINEAMKPSQDPQTVHGPGCCSDIFETQKVAALASSGGESAKAFASLMRSVQAGGALEEKTKELILFALVVASRCEPCFKSHWDRAKELGLTQEQLDEAAWCAVAMGGAPVRMFYKEAMARC